MCRETNSDKRFGEPVFVDRGVFDRLIYRREGIEDRNLGQKPCETVIEREEGI